MVDLKKIIVRHFLLYGIVTLKRVRDPKNSMMCPINGILFLYESNRKDQTIFSMPL